MYKTLARPHFYYYVLIDNSFNHDRTLNYLMQRIEKVQYQAVLAITGTWQGSDSEHMKNWDGKPFLIKGLCTLFKLIQNNMTLHLNK